MVEKEKKEEQGIISYILGIISIVLAFFIPLAGLILGIIGFIQIKKQETDLLKKARKLNLIGIVLSAILFVVSIVIAYLSLKGINLFGNLPV